MNTVLWDKIWLNKRNVIQFVMKLWPHICYNVSHIQTTKMLNFAITFWISCCNLKKQTFPNSLTIISRSHPPWLDYSPISRPRWRCRRSHITPLATIAFLLMISPFNSIRKPPHCPSAISPCHNHLKQTWPARHLSESAPISGTLSRIPLQHPNPSLQ
jgi:hypothetical protein